MRWFVCFMLKNYFLALLMGRRQLMKIIMIALALSVLSGCAIVPLACYDCYGPYYGFTYSTPSDASYSSSRYPLTGLADSPSSPNTDYYGYQNYRPQYPGHYGYGYHGYQYPGYYRYHRPWY